MVQWEWTLSSSGIQPPFSSWGKLYICFAHSYMQHVVTVLLIQTRNSTVFLPHLIRFPCFWFVILSILSMHLVNSHGLGLAKVRGEVTEKRTSGGVQMMWLLKRLGIQQPHGRRVITPTHEGVLSRVWQSSHNSGLIHHMGIMQLTGTTPKKSYTRSSPASESLNNPIPLLSTHCLVGKRQSKWAGIID